MGVGDAGEERRGKDGRAREQRGRRPGERCVWCLCRGQGRGAAAVGSLEPWRVVWRHASVGNQWGEACGTGIPVGSWVVPNYPSAAIAPPSCWAWLAMALLAVGIRWECAGSPLACPWRSQPKTRASCSSTGQARPSAARSCQGLACSDCGPCGKMGRGWADQGRQGSQHEGQALSGPLVWPPCRAPGPRGEGAAVTRG